MKKLDGGAIKFVHPAFFEISSKSLAVNSVLIQALVERQARGTVEALAGKYQELEKKYHRAEERLKAVDTERRDREYRLKQAELFVATLKKLPEGDQIESTELFMALVDKVLAGEGLTFVFKGRINPQGTVLGRASFLLGR